MRRITKFGMAVGVLVLWAASECLAMPVLGDYDGDGRSDLAVALVDRARGETPWLVRLSSGESPLFWTFSKPGDALVTGHFYGDGKVYPGLVWVRDARMPLEWYLMTPQGTELFIRYGLPGDSIPNLGDLDCDGITDFIVTRNGRSNYYPGFKLWYVALSGYGGAVLEEVFGTVNDRLYVADLDGDGCQEMVALRDGFYSWFGKKLFSSNISQVQWGLPGDIPLLPQDLNGDGRADYIISRPTGNGQVGYVRYSDSEYTTFDLGQNTSIPMVGNFTGTPGFAWAQRDTGFTGIRQNDGSVDVFPFGIPTNAIIRPDGTVVQPTDNARFGGTGGGDDDDDDDDLPPQCDEELDREDGPSGFVSNPANSRRTLKIVLPNRYTGEIETIKFYTESGEYFGTVHEQIMEYDNREAYYGTVPIAEYPENLLVVVTLTNGENLCVVLPDPHRRYD